MKPINKCILSIIRSKKFETLNQTVNYINKLYFIKLYRTDTVYM